MGAIKHIKYIFLSAAMLLVVCIAQSQIGREKLDKRITISKDQMRIDSLLDLFSKQTGIEFSFNSKKIKPGKMIPVKKGGQTLAGCLSQLQRNTGIHYAAIGNHIILLDNPPAEKHALNLQVKPATSSTSVVAKEGSNKKDLLIGRRTNRVENNAGKEVEEIDEKVRIRYSDPLWHVQNISATPVVPAPGTYISTSSVVKVSTGDTANSNAGTSNRIPGARKTNVSIPAGFSIGISLSRPDVYPDITGIGGDIQYEKLFGEKFSATASIGYNLFIGEYKDAPFTGDSSVKKNFANIPVTAGLRYYALRGLYFAAELGEAFSAGKGNASHLSLTPAAGYKFRVGNSAIDISIKYTRIPGGGSIPENSALKKGEYNILSFRAAFVF